MKRGYAGDFVPLLPAMLAGAAMDQGEGSTQPAEPHHTPVDPLPSTSLPPIQSPPHSPPQSPPHSPPQSPPHSPPQSPPYSPHQSPPHSPHQSPPHSPLESPPYLPPHYSPPRSYEAPLPDGNTLGSAKASIQLKELMVLVPNLVNKVTSLEKELKETKQTLGNAVVKLVEKVKSLELALKRKSKKAAKTLSKVASQSVNKAKSTNKGKRYRRRERSMAKKINTGLDAKDEINTSRIEINIGIEDVNTGSTKVDTGRTRLSEQQLKRKAEVQKAAQFYTEEYWDTIRAKLDANTKVVKSIQGESISNDDFAKKNGGNDKREEEKLSFEELKTEFEKLMKSIESFMPMETEARVKRHGLQLEQETSKKQKIDIEDASITKGKDEVVKEEETKVPTAQDEFNKEREAYVKDKVKDASSESEIGVDVIPTATKPPTIVNWKIISQSSQKIGDKEVNTPEEMYDKVLSGDLKTMFDPPLSDDAIWSLPLQQRIINWRYYPTCDVHCITLDSSTIYMLVDRKYHLSKDAYQVMLKMKLLDGTMDEVCYQLLKMIKKQAGIRKHKVRVGLNGNLLWEASILLGRKKGGVRVAREDDYGVTEGREDVREVFQQRGSGAKRKLSRCRRNQMGNEPILAFPEGAGDFVVYYNTRSKDLEACLEKGRR
ncbi:hypothetical protein Tco_1024394 [Tanacetum coccineum]